MNDDTYNPSSHPSAEPGAPRSLQAVLHSGRAATSQPRHPPGGRLSDRLHRR